MFPGPKNLALNHTCLKLKSESEIHFMLREPESQEKPKRHIFWNSLFGIFVNSTQFPFIL